jgi:hypothetical protein
MANYRTTRIIPIALTLVIVAIAIAALVSLARLIFFSGGTNTTTSQINIIKDALLNTSADRSVRMTVRGEIVADETFRSYQIQIAPNERTITTYKGYLDQPIGNISLGNNIPAYEQFVYALDKANFMKGTELTGDKNDLRGICATGYVYEFQILKAEESLKQLWTSSCSVARGSLNAKLDQLTKLFIAQISDAKSIIGKLW